MDVPTDDSAAARLDAMELRLSVLEEQITHAAPGSSSVAELQPSSGADFFALEGVQRSMPDGGVVYAGAVTVAAGPVEWQIGLTTEQVMGGDWSAVAPALAALGSPVRVGLMQAVLAGATTVGELNALDEIGTTGQLYHHLGQLTAAGWLHAEGRGRYAVPADRVVPIMVIIAAAGRL